MSRSVSISGKDQNVIVYPLIISVASFPDHFQIYLAALEKNRGCKIKSGSGLGTRLMYQFFYLVQQRTGYYIGIYTCMQNVPQSCSTRVDLSYAPTCDIGK